MPVFVAESWFFSTDDFAGKLTNQTNLAIKGTIGIGAMGVIEGLLGNTASKSNYTVCIFIAGPSLEF